VEVHSVVSSVVLFCRFADEKGSALMERTLCFRIDSLYFFRLVGDRISQSTTSEATTKIEE